MEMHDIQRGAFVDRPNRFIAHVALDGEVVTCHMPNPGRMWELLFPGVPVYVRPAGNPKRRTAYDVVGIERDGVPILLDTQYNNDTAAWLVAEHLVPGWEDWDLVRREVTVGDSRFDLLLGRGEERFFVEVKSCTLFSCDGAMFPDAVTERGRKHILELAEMSRHGIHTGVLFLVHWDRARWFLPDYHTDPAFAQAFQEAAPQLDWKALALAWDASFQRPEPVRLLTYPEAVLSRENHDGGDYLFVLHLNKTKDISVGSLGTLHFPQGYYVYAGSAKKNLAARLARHSRKRKKMHWHIDYLRQEADVVAALPIRTADDLEHDLARAVAKIADWQIDGFGCTDCRCPSHLFGFAANPIHERAFIQIVEDFRMNRLASLMTELCHLAAKD
ncbi:DNA/RNA nuclease SfsA [uncultured Megasphaera sp.]|uniref:DNA/RNA nuclease SfsA n=1 Tax=uncultured Megasphaera sp. TaxID=165188 RepID=UPI0025CC8672|nr:DNA/RNA nuclease SfsA [uncultured Megasphaera sp.]